MVQGVGSGIAISIGYFLGVVIRWLLQYLEVPFRSFIASIPIKSVLTSMLTLLVGASMFYFVSWQNELRVLFGIEPIGPLFLVPVLIIAISIFILLLIVSRVVLILHHAIVHALSRILSQRFSYVIGTVIALLLVVFTVNGVLIRTVFDAANASFSISNGSIDPSLEPPMIAEVSGSPSSAVRWDSLGRNGRMFIADTPSAQDISSVTKMPALQPIRAYVGLDSAPTLEERSQLLLDELIRTGAFERSSLLITTSVGDGWLDAQAINPFEYVNNGDTAVAGLQYSYLPSALSLFADAEDVKSSSQLVFKDIYTYWLTLPENNRPQIYLYGLSLGSYGVESVLNSVDLMNAPVRGALLAGPPFINEFHRDILRNRDEGSPLWQPIVSNGLTVRFSGKENALAKPIGTWGDTRIVYLQHASDPITWFQGDLFYRSPEWLRPEQRGPDISDTFVWIPIVTAYQIGLDMILSFNYPAGYAHNYAASSHVDAWAAITRPDGWTEDRAQKLKQHFQ